MAPSHSLYSFVHFVGTPPYSFVPDQCTSAQKRVINSIHKPTSSSRLYLVVESDSQLFLHSLGIEGVVPRCATEMTNGMGEKP